MPRYKLIIEYDGTPFFGWQWQDTLPSVQGALMHAVQSLNGEKAMVQGAGRTGPATDGSAIGRDCQSHAAATAMSSTPTDGLSRTTAPHGASR